MHLRHVMRNPVYAIWEQQSRRSSAQADQRLCCSLPGWYTSNFYIRNLKPLPSICSWAGWFESTLVANPVDMFFFRDVAHFHGKPHFQTSRTTKLWLWCGMYIDTCSTQFQTSCSTNFDWQLAACNVHRLVYFVVHNWHCRSCRVTGPIKLVLDHCYSPCLFHLTGRVANLLII